MCYDQPIVLNERLAGAAIEGDEQHNRAEDRIRIPLLAVDTHGVTNVAMVIAKLLGFDLCPRLRDLRERKLFVPRGWPASQTLEGVTVRRVSFKAIERGWDDLVRLVASIRAGKVFAAHAVHRLGSAAFGDPLHRFAEHLGRLLRTPFQCDYLAIPACLGLPPYPAHWCCQRVLRSTTGLIFSRCALRLRMSSKVAICLAPAASAQARWRASPARRALWASSTNSAAR